MARYALVIGIADYQGSLPRLSKTTTDAEAIAQVLEQYGNFQEVKRLPARWNAEKNCYEMVARPVTGAELGQALRTFLQEQAVNSEALIYFAGHGIQVFDHLGQQSGYLATSDCTFETKEGRIVDQRHGISLDSFNNTIRSSNLSSLVVLLDCCHSGYLLERSFIEQTLTAFNSSSRRDYCLITASRGFEKAYVGQEHSIFTEAVLDGLSRKNAESDGQLGQTISGDRLFDYISRALKNSGQEPLRLGWGRSIPLVTYPIEQTATNPGEFKPENPYLGLYAFNTEQADYFFGREPAVKELIERLSNNRFLAVIGPSGCGKSSLVKAGLFPEFQSDRLPGSSQWEIESFTPGKHPIEPLLEILARQHRKQQPYVLFIDQLEELFTLCEDETERRSFIRMMSEEATSSDRPTRVIVAIRGDFLDRCAAYPETAVLINRTRTTTYFVTPLSPLALEEVIEQPASLHGVTFERGLVSQIANDVEDQPGALPLLQYALKELWRVCIEEASSPQTQLTWQGYEAIGGVKGALEQRANLLYRSFSSADQAFVRRLCLELVQLGEGEEVTRRRASWERLEAIADSPEQLQRVVRLLAGQQQRLIITDEKTAEVAHEALLAEWTLLRHWIEENRETIRISRRLEADCREWQDKGQSDDYLLTAGRLVAIAEWVEKTQPKLPTLEAEFLQKSLKKRDQELQAQLNQERQKTRVTIIASLFAVTAAGLTLLVQQQEQQVQIGRALTAQALVSQADNLLDNNNQIEALLSSLDALEYLQESDLQNTSILGDLEEVVFKVQEYNRIQENTEPILSVSVSTSGSKIVTASADGTTKIWTNHGTIFKDISRKKDPVFRIKFSPNSQMVAAANADGSVTLWKESGEFLRNIPGHRDNTYDLSFSPDSKMLASSGRDGQIRLWDITHERLIQTHQEKERVLRLEFSPNGQFIVFTSRTPVYSVKLWDWKNNSVEILGRHESALGSVNYSSNGSMLLSSDFDGNVNLWFLNSNQNKVVSKKHFKVSHKGYVTSTVFTPDNQAIISTGEDGAIKLWDLEGNSIEQIQAHKNDVNQVDFTPKISSMVSTGDDSTIRFWRLKTVGHTTYLSSNSQRKDNLLRQYSCNFVKDYLTLNRSKLNQLYNQCQPYFS